jgi:hypothetical protein
MVKTIYKKRLYKKAKHTGMPESIETSIYLIIVESPSKCKKIEEYLGSQYTCISSKGHIRSIKNGLKSIDVKNNYDIEFETIEEAQTKVGVLFNEDPTGRIYKVVLRNSDGTFSDI